MIRLKPRYLKWQCETCKRRYTHPLPSGLEWAPQCSKTISCGGKNMKPVGEPVQAGERMAA